MSGASHSAVSGHAGISMRASFEGDAATLAVSGPQGKLGEARFDADRLSAFAERLAIHLRRNPPLRGAQPRSFSLDGLAGSRLEVKDLGVHLPRILVELSGPGRWWQEAKFDEQEFLGWLDRLCGDSHGS
jgi:hypothetical protein